MLHSESADISAGRRLKALLQLTLGHVFRSRVQVTGKFPRKVKKNADTFTQKHLASFQNAFKSVNWEMFNQSMRKDLKCCGASLFL